MDCDLRNDDKEVCLCIVNAAIEVGKGARRESACRERRDERVKHFGTGQIVARVLHTFCISVV